jgi:Cu/Ag efflux pump CusA
MTSVTTILGMLPMALGFGDGSELWQPMGIAIIGGMTFSTLLTLLVIPVLYAMFQLRKDNKAQDKLARSRRRAEKERLRLAGAGTQTVK